MAAGRRPCAIFLLLLSWSVGEEATIDPNGHVLPQDLVFAARNGDTDAVVSWLDAGGDVNAFTTLQKPDGGTHRWTLLASATAGQHRTLINELVRRGADPEFDLGGVVLDRSAASYLM